MGTYDAAVLKQAREWFVILLDAPTAAKQAQFEKWLKADPAHFDAYGAVESAWLNAEPAGRRLAAKDQAPLAAYLDAIAAARSRKKVPKHLSALGIFLAVMLAGYVWMEHPTLLQDAQADHVTARGERREIRLPDGSSVLLEADSALAVAYGAGERRVRLLRGGAYFEVNPSPEAFTVAAANAEVSVLGTGFDVRLLDDGGRVTLAHGRVSLRTRDRALATELVPGQQAFFGADGVQGVHEVELADALAWREGRLVFHQARLADVVHDLERYRAGRIIITAPSLQNERVTGSLPLMNADDELTSLQASLGFKMFSLAGRITIISP